MKHFNLVKDLSIVTSVPAHLLDRMAELSSAIIAHDALEAVKQQENVSIDLGFGSLCLKVVADESIVWKFIPSKSLETILVEAVDSHKDLLIEKAEQSLSTKIANAYKDLL